VKPATLLAAVAVLILAAFLRFHALDAQSFWNDEGNSARLSERPIAQIIEGTASDVHPPLYYLLLHGWRAGAGATEFGLRAFSALAGVLTVAATMALARAVSPRPGAVMIAAGLLAAVSPPLVYYAQETRMYALLALVAVLSTWTLWHWYQAQRTRSGGRAWLWLAAYALLLAAGLYTHYFFPAIILGQGLLVASAAVMSALKARRTESHGEPWRALAAWGAAVAVAALVYAAWLPIFLRQVGGRSGAPQSLLDYLSRSGLWLGMGTTLPAPTAAWVLLAAAVLVVLGIAGGRRRALVPLVMAAVPIGGSYLAGATDPAFFKFLLTAVPFLCVLGGLAWRLNGWQRVAPLLLTAAVLIGSGLSLSNMFNDPVYARADYRGMAARIAAEGHPNAAVILNAPNQWEVFTYYHRDGAPVYPLPRGQPDPALLDPALADIAATYDRLYVLFWGDAQRDPERIVERWLDVHTFKTDEQWVGDVRFVTYAVPPADPVPPTPAGFEFDTGTGEPIVLAAYAVQPTTGRPGDVVAVQLLWSAASDIPQAYKVFVHLIDDSGRPLVQRDSEPAGGSRPTTTWQPGETIIDNHGLLLPPGLAPGAYRLVVGLYDPADPMQRLPVTVDGTVKDTAPLGTITVP
jgi:hypothetical protein